MSQAIAGESIGITVDGELLWIKVEDASKSETISGKVEISELASYRVGEIYEFDRSVLTAKQS